MNCTGKRCLMQYDKVDPATCPCVSYCPQATPPRTNGDCLRAMNNEELCNEYFRILNHVLGRYTAARAGLLEWLNQPVE